MYETWVLARQAAEHEDSRMTAYYNEIDPFKAEVLREAIKAGAIAPGDVDERSIADIDPAELVGYTQCHFFAGGGFWSLALRQAGWPDDRPVWTGSCPCPSFSVAGKGEGFNDPRHLWPKWYRLIRECRPPAVFGEQVAAAIGHGWLDLVCGDLEAEGYAIAPAVLGAHSVGAPHIRQRLYFVAKSEGIRRGSGLRDSRTGEQRRSVAPYRRCDGIMVNATGRGCGISGDEAQWLADAERHGGRPDQQERRSQRRDADGRDCETLRPSPLNGHWRDADWIGCRDGKFRPVKPGAFPLAHGYPARVGLLRLAGDAICVPAAKEFIEAYLESQRVTV